ncbi:MAG: phosphoglucosamine mutase [Clostridiales Family XIII bacterium]|jgi:phosphoglucosamine mutase|nr:phosphoglucosamine mutase [Clostridiales Family XIII bacterium]
MGKLFGTDGVRGIANKDLTPELACALGKAGTSVLAKASGGASPIVIIGKDTRISGDMLEDGLSAGIQAMGGSVIRVGVAPTPTVAFLVRDMGVDCGAVISASHNPFEYNGIKFFNSEGFKLDGALEDEIEAIVLNESAAAESHALGADIGETSYCEDDALQRYVEHLLEGMSVSLKGIKVVADCANGAAVGAARMLFEALGADLITIGDRPDGTNINDGVGSTHPEKLREAVVASGANIGFAFDGDADRLIAVDENGGIIDGDKIMYICATHYKRSGRLSGNLLTATVMSNIGLRFALEREGIDLQIADVGDRYVLELMRSTGCVVGGEQSGHIIFLDHNTTGDGLYASLKLIEALADMSVRASEAAAAVRIYPQALRNARVKNENKGAYLSDPEIGIAIEKTEKKYDGEGRALIRASGTEPLVRVMIEGPDAEEVARDAAELSELIEKKLG